MRSVVRINAATEAAFCKALRVTLDNISKIFVPVSHNVDFRQCRARYSRNNDHV